MDLLEALVSLAVLWRVVVGAFAGGLAGVAVAALVPGLGSSSVLVGALLGAAGGILWLASQSSAKSLPAIQAPEPSRVVIFGAVWALGVLWGSLLSVQLGLFQSAALLAAGTPAIAWLSRRFTGRRVSALAQVGAVLMLWLGLAVSHVSGWATSQEASNPSIERTASSKLRLLPAAAHVER